MHNEELSILEIEETHHVLHLSAVLHFQNAESRPIQLQVMLLQCRNLPYNDESLFGGELLSVNPSKNHTTNVFLLLSYFYEATLHLLSV